MITQRFQGKHTVSVNELIGIPYEKILVHYTSYIDSCLYSKSIRLVITLEGMKADVRYKCIADYDGKDHTVKSIEQTYNTLEEAVNWYNQHHLGG